MQKIGKSKISVIKVVFICIILILLSSAGVMAVTNNFNTIEIELSDGYKMKVLTSKTKVSEILSDNNIILENNQKSIPSIEEEISENKKIKITDKSSQEIEIAKISESGIETTLEELLNSYTSIIEKIEVIEEKIPFETITKDISDGASSTTNKVLQQGKEGIKKITFKVKYQNDTEISRTKIAEEIVQEPVDKIVQVKSNVVTTRSSTQTRGNETAQVAVSGSKADYQSYARQKCLEYGWGENEFNCLVNLWNKESGWNPNCHNKSSGAHGIPQALPASKMASAGSDYMTNYKTQINWGLGYIKSRYGSPSNAWSHFKIKNWY